MVEHKATFRAVTDDDRLEEYNGYERETALYNDQLGEEAQEAWRKQAPDEPNPSVRDDL